MVAKSWGLGAHYVIKSMLNPLPLISVIIPVYNAADYLAPAIDSVLAQTYPAIEIIVIDDGSTDGSTEVSRLYTEKIRYIRQTNQGVSAARNRGILEARGEYIAFLDADDTFFPDKITRQMEVFDRYPEVGGVGASFIVKSGDRELRFPALGTLFSEGTKCGILEDVFKHLDPGNVFAVPLLPTSVIVRKCVFDKVGGFRTDLKIGEDHELWARIAAHYAWGFLDEPVALHNRGSTVSVTNNLVAIDRARTYLESLYGDRQMRKILPTKLYSNYRDFRGKCAWAVIGLGLRAGDRAFVGRCLGLAFPRIIAARFIIIACIYCLPSRLWPMLIRGVKKLQGRGVLSPSDRSNTDTCKVSK